MRIVTLDFLSSFERPARESFHQSSRLMPIEGCSSSSPDHELTLCQTSLAKKAMQNQVVSYLRFLVTKGLQGQFLAISLSAVRILDCTSNQAKNLCFPSVSAFQIA